MKHNIAQYAPILEKLTLPMQRYFKTYLDPTNFIDQDTFESRISALPSELQEDVNIQITNMGLVDSIMLGVMEIPVSVHGELMALSAAIECLEFAERNGTVAYTPTQRDPYTWRDITGIPYIKGQVDAIINSAEQKAKEAAKLVSPSSSSSSRSSASGPSESVSSSSKEKVSSDPNAESRVSASVSALSESTLDEEAEVLLKRGEEHLKNYDEWFWVGQYEDGAEESEDEADESEGDRLMNDAITCFLAVSQKHAYKRDYREAAIAELKKIENMGFSIPATSSSSSSSMSSVSVSPSFGVAIPLSSSSSSASSSSAVMPISSSSSSSLSSSAEVPISSSVSSSSASSSAINDYVLYHYTQSILGLVKLERERLALDKEDAHFAAKDKAYAAMIKTQRDSITRREKEYVGIQDYCEQRLEYVGGKIEKSLQLPRDVLERYLEIEKEYESQKKRFEESRDRRVKDQFSDSMENLIAQEYKIVRERLSGLEYFNVRDYAKLAKIDLNWPFQQKVMRAPEAVATLSSSLGRFVDRVSSTFSGRSFFSKPAASSVASSSSSSSSASQATVSNSSRGFGNADYDYLLKFVVIGDIGVGKSSLVVRYAEDVFPESSISEIARINVDFKMRTMDVQGYTIKLQVWDLPRQQQNVLHANNPARSARAVIIAFDVTNRESFRRMERDLQQLRANSPDIQLVLAATKCDVYPWQVTGNEIQIFAAQHNVKVYFTSAKDNSNSKIDALFSETAVRIITPILPVLESGNGSKPPTTMGHRS